MLLHRVPRTLPWAVCLLVWAAGPPLALGLTFTDDPLVPRTTTVKVVQVTELRSDIDTVRGRLGLDAFSWTDPALVAHATPIKRMHVIDLRTALDEAYQRAGKPLPTYTDATILVGQTFVKASHLNDVRGVFRALFTPTITGPLHAGSRSVNGTGIPGSSVQLFINGVARGAPVIVNALGQWTVSNLTPALGENDVVTAQETVSGLSSDVSTGVVVGPMLTQIAFVHADGSSCPPLANCAFNLRLLDPLNPANQAPMTAFPVGTLTSSPAWSKDFQTLAFASSYNNTSSLQNYFSSLEPFLSVYTINANGTNLQQLTGSGFLGQLPGPVGTLTGQVVAAPVHVPVPAAPGTPACPNPLPPSGITESCRLPDGTYLVPGTIVSCLVTAQGMETAPGMGVPVACSNVGTTRSSFQLPGVPQASSWVLAWARVTYNDSRIPTPNATFFGFVINLTVRPGLTTNVGTIGVQALYHVSTEPSWSPDGTQLIVTGTNHASSPQFLLGFATWQQTQTSELEFVPVAGTIVSCLHITPDVTVAACIVPFPTVLQLVDAVTGARDGTISPPFLAYQVSGSDWSTAGIAFAFNGTSLSGFLLQGIVVMDPSGGNARLLLTQPLLSTVLRVVKQARWSPDGLRIALTQTTVSSAQIPTDDLFVVDAAGGNLVQLTQSQSGQNIDGISWSPDGHRIAFDVVNTTGPFPDQTPTTADLFAINADGTGRVRLTTDGRSFNPAWRTIP